MAVQVIRIVHGSKYNVVGMNEGGRVKHSLVKVYMYIIPDFLRSSFGHAGAGWRKLQQGVYTYIRYKSCALRCNQLKFWNEVVGCVKWFG